jgi:ubiquitin-protein ligase
MEGFVFYDLVQETIIEDVKSKVNVDVLLDQVNYNNTKKDSIMSPDEVGKSIIKELIKIEKIYKHLSIIDLYNLEICNFSKDFPDYTIKLTLDPNYYPMLTPDISLNPVIDPIIMYELISQPELDIRNTGKIRNIEYIINTTNKFLLDNHDKLECKLNYNITNLMILLLKNNNYRIKIKDTNVNVTTVAPVTKNSGIGYGGTANRWDANAYLNNLTRIKETNTNLLNNIIFFLEDNKENKDLIEIHTRFNLYNFWIDLLEKYEITENKYYSSINMILQIIKFLELKIKIPFFDEFKKMNQKHSKEDSNIISNIISCIDEIQIETISVDSEDTNYKILQDIQMGYYSYIQKQKHNFIKEVNESSSFAKAGTPKIIQKQFEMIMKSIPISKDNIIFIRQDPDQMCLFKFMIIPNEDTPYKFGCFVFEVFLPSNFPNVCPLVSHSTSRKNSFRFNPNLYHCGKVCLSLLGTWGGHQSENWIPPNADGTGSTLMQLILSIYSMIFTEDPWYNEPGRERDIKNAKTNTQSINYNDEIKIGTIKFAILQQLKCPEEGFEDAIKAYYTMNKDRVYKYLLDTDKKYANTFNTLIN